MPNTRPVTIDAATGQPLKQQATWKRVIIAILAFLYILSPLDLLPEAIPLIGWLDDLGVLAWAARQVFFKRD
ncbi:MAG: YkvA family protein [Casimicrobiaceae bacterium]|nr:YkvA family protein [Casimicrobiaceae bacterium]